MYYLYYLLIFIICFGKISGCIFASEELVGCLFGCVTTPFEYEGLKIDSFYVEEFDFPERQLNIFNQTIASLSNKIELDPYEQEILNFALEKLPNYPNLTEDDKIRVRSKFRVESEEAGIELDSSTKPNEFSRSILIKNLFRFARTVIRMADNNTFSGGTSKDDFKFVEANLKTRSIRGEISKYPDSSSVANAAVVSFDKLWWHEGFEEWFFRYFIYYPVSTKKGDRLCKFKTRYSPTKFYQFRSNKVFFQL